MQQTNNTKHTGMAQTIWPNISSRKTEQRSCRVYAASLMDLIKWSYLPAFAAWLALLLHTVQQAHDIISFYPQIAFDIAAGTTARDKRLHHDPLPKGVVIDLAEGRSFPQGQVFTQCFASFDNNTRHPDERLKQGIVLRA